MPKILRRHIENLVKDWTGASLEISDMSYGLLEGKDPHGRKDGTWVVHGPPIGPIELMTVERNVWQKWATNPDDMNMQCSIRRSLATHVWRAPDGDGVWRQMEIGERRPAQPISLAAPRRTRSRSPRRSYTEAPPRRFPPAFGIWQDNGQLAHSRRRQAAPSQVL